LTTRNEIRDSGHSTQQNVYAMVGFSASFKFYLRSTFGHGGQICFSKAHHCIDINVVCYFKSY
jgi:hypothetical protein